MAVSAKARFHQKPKRYDSSFRQGAFLPAKYHNIQQPWYEPFLNFGLKVKIYKN